MPTEQARPSVHKSSCIPSAQFTDSLVKHSASHSASSPTGPERRRCAIGQCRWAGRRMKCPGIGAWGGRGGGAPGPDVTGASRHLLRPLSSSLALGCEPQGGCWRPQAWGLLPRGCLRSHGSNFTIPPTWASGSSGRALSNAIFSPGTQCPLWN